MGKATTNTVLDAALALLKSSADAVQVCTSEPTTYAEANSTYNLATGAITSADWTGPADDASGRKLTCSACGLDQGIGISAVLHYHVQCSVIDIRQQRYCAGVDCYRHS